MRSWIPALNNGVIEDKLKRGKRGAKVADVGGYGNSTIIMAKASPNSTFFGFDFHAPSMLFKHVRG